MLRDLNFKAVYRTEDQNLLDDFYIPALTVSVAYDRAVGYFSAAMLSYAAQGLSAFIENDGKMRLIFGGEIQADEADAISEGYDLRFLQQKVAERLVHIIDNVTDMLCYRRLEALAWMVANGTLDIKVALKQAGMYHEKIGIMTDAVGDRIVFQGSANETANAMLPDFNFESINVFPTWRSELRDHFQPYIEGFDQLWNKRSKQTVVIDFPEAAREKLLKIAKRGSRPSPKIESDIWKRLKESLEDTGPLKLPFVPDTLNGREFAIMPHQRQALNRWRTQDWQGILALATGAGKTVTALYAIAKLFPTLGNLFVVISVPYQSLGDQWLSEAKRFGISAIACYGGVNLWRETLSEYALLYRTGALKFCCVVVVNRTLQGQEFQSILKAIPGQKLLFIGDECHHHRAEKLNDALPKHAEMRLGLSATPEQYYQTSEADTLTEYYGPIAFKYDLADALRDGVLTPYDYKVVLIDLTGDESEEYERLSTEISRLAGSGGIDKIEDEPDDQLKLLLFRRSRLLGSAQNKIGALKSLIERIPPQPLTLFYCGDGSVEDEDIGESVRQVESVATTLHGLGWRASQFTAREPRAERQLLLDGFRHGSIDALVAIRCLDEGIDLPACRMAFLLASSRNPRQLIQRRGRILRRSPGKEFSVIYDFLVLLPPMVCQRIQLERQLLAAELKRAAEFARLARNPGEAYRTLEDLLKKYDLEHVFI
jgi:superfamily II DNA or RNA helicase